MTFHLGQRWISDSESDQGLGTIVSVEARLVTVLFTATGESRQYASANAPLTRVQFNVGDTVPSHEGWQLQILEVEEQDHLFTYHGTRTDTGEAASLKEMMLDHFIKFNNPHDRLLNGQIDRLDWFRLRKQALKHQFELQQSAHTGLTGGRVSLIPHQLYIAEEVGQRYAPRVLLADEVGLGKTIEAGLIIHQQLVTGHAGRVLIVVPEPLMHQWLVEMLRRFNLHFSIFDAERCAQFEEGENPFSSEQLVLVNMDFLAQNAEQFENIAAEEWDLLVVDEAHHLHWSVDNASIEYQCVEMLSQVIPGVLLLTATPDQLGHESHFARLRLLDSDRFYDYQKFLAEEQDYAQVAQAANSLIAGKALTAADIELLTQLLKETDISEQLAQLADESVEEDVQKSTREGLVNQLLDRHGTGRILFRNSRNTIKGFPGRELHAAPLPMPAEYKACQQALLDDTPLEELMSSRRSKHVFTPETLYKLTGESASWYQFDPKVDYLIELLTELKQEKTLVICAHAQTAIDLETALRTKQGIRAAVFHEGMSIIERDRAAAYFAQTEDSAQVLICSEIGSEGRNFQFAHHLVLFDLPQNPDLLEQRIGRLDRIGQTQTIKLHVPYFEDSPQSLLFNWYLQALHSFEHTCVTGSEIFKKYHKQLLELALVPDSAKAEALVSESKTMHLELKAQLEQGRDKLLEIHSSGQGRAHQLVSEIEKRDNETELAQFMFQAFDIFGIAQDDKLDASIALNMTEHMLTPNFPCLGDEGTTITFNRDLALSCEDYQFMSWDHPMVRGTIDLVLTDEIGNASICLLKNPNLPAGTFFVECLFALEATAPAQLQLNRYLPTTPIRILVDKAGNNLAAKVAEDVLEKQLSPVKKQTALQLIKALKGAIQPLVDKAKLQAEAQVDTIREHSRDNMQKQLNDEFERLTALAQINPNVREAEIEFIKVQMSELNRYIDASRLKFEAIRLIVATD